MSEGWEPAGGRGRGWIAAAAVGGVLLAAVAVLADRLGEGEPAPATTPPSDEIVIDEGATDEEADPLDRGGAGEGARSARPADRVGSWRALPALPGDVASADPVVAWVDGRLVLWGGRGSDGWRGDGARYDPDADRWSVVPRAPVVAAAGTGAAPAGDRLAVLGARDEAGGEAHGLLDADDGGWDPLPAAPPGSWRWDEAVATGSGVAVPGDDGAPAVAHVDPGEGRWRLLEPPPLAEVLVLVHLPETGLVAVGPAQDDPSIAATAHAAGAWGEPEAAPVPPRWSVRAAAAPDGATTVLIARPPGPRPQATAWTWSPDRPVSWHELAAPPVRPGFGGTPRLASVQEGVIAWSPERPASERFLAGDALDPGAAGGAIALRWAPLATGPYRPAARRRLLATDGALLRLDEGAEARPATVSLWQGPGLARAPHPSDEVPFAEGAWRRRALGIVPRHVPGLVDAGDGRLAVLGGLSGGRPLRDGLLVDPATGEHEAIPPAPWDGDRVLSAVASIDGRLVAWGGTAAGEAVADGAAFDLEAGTWEVLPDAPLDGEHTPVAIDDGDGRALVIAGRQAARYELDARRWTPVEDLPTRGGVVAAVRPPGEGVIVLDDAGGAARYADGRWARIDPPGLPGQPAATVIGEHVVAWSGRSGAVRDPDSGRWWPVAPPWRATSSVGLAAAGDRAVVWGASVAGRGTDARPSAAVLDPERREWHRLPAPPRGASPGRLVTVDGVVVGWPGDGSLLVLDGEDGAVAGR